MKPSNRAITITPALVAVLCALAAQAFAAPDPAPAAGPPASKVFLSWHAPFGMPGATDTLTAACDSSRVDTLWLAFKPGKMSPTFIAFTASILVRPAPGDTLSAWWHDDGGSKKPVHFELAYDPWPGFGYPSPFHMNGAGGAMYWREGNDMRLKFVYATPYTETRGIDRRTYVLARILVRRPPAESPGCGEPVCLMASEVQLNFYLGADHEEIDSGADRFVSLNSPGGAVIVPYRAAARSLWRPKTP